MPERPLIHTPCPVADRLEEVMEGDFCRRCRKRVVDLDILTEPARLRLLAAARRTLCVRYAQPARAALAMATLAVALPAAAQQEAPPFADVEPASSMTEIVVGGARRLTRAERIEAEREARRLERQEQLERRRAKRTTNEQG